MTDGWTPGPRFQHRRLPPKVITIEIMPTYGDGPVENPDCTWSYGVHHTDADGYNCVSGGPERTLLGAMLAEHRTAKRLAEGP